MSTLEPTLFIGIGCRGRQVLHDLKGQILSAHGALPALRWLALDVAGTEAPASPPPPTEDDPAALSAEETFYIPWDAPQQPGPSRAESQQAFRAASDALDDRLRQTLPTLTSYEAIAATRAAGFEVADTLQMAVYIVADLGDPVGGALADPLAHLIARLCRQQGRQPRCAGVFFLPDATQADPVAEANAYAALKELDAHLTDPDLRRNGHTASQPLPLSIGPETAAIFDRGCYLLDTLNERAYTVPLQMLVEQAARWLYGMSVLALYRIIDDTFDLRLAQRSIRRKIRAYGSFGLAGHSLYSGAFRDWYAARLGQTVVRQGLLDPEGVHLPAGAVEDFVARNGLRAPDLTALLRAAIVTAVSEQSIGHLRSGQLDELDDRLRGALRQVREVDLPLQQQQVRHSLTALNRQVRDALAQKLLALMRQSPCSALANAREFLCRLDAEMAAQEKELAQQEQGYNAYRHQVIAQASRLGYQLKTTLMSLPPRPVLVLAVLGGLLLPLVYWLAVTLAVAKLPDGARIWLIWPLLLGGAGLVVAYQLWRSRRQSEKQRAAYVEHLHTRAELELTPLLSHAASTLYQQVRVAISQSSAELEQLAARLEQAAESLDAREREAAAAMAEQARPGPWQSLLTPELAQEFCPLDSADLETHLPAAIEALGPPDNWPNCTAGVLIADLLAHSQEHLRRSGRLRIQDVLRQRFPTTDELSQWLTGLLHRAAPQCAFSDNLSSRSVTPSRVAHVLILDESLGDELATLLSELAPDIQVLKTGNSQSIVAVAMRWGLPAFALRRLDQYWAAYAAALRQNNLALHVSPDDLLLPEPTPAPAGLPDRAALLAVALGLGLIAPHIADPILIQDASGQAVSLGRHKETAAVLLGQWPAGARALHRTVREAVTGLGGRAVAHRLQHYLHSAADLATWERQAIEQFLASLQ